MKKILSIIITLSMIISSNVVSLAAGNEPIGSKSSPSNVSREMTNEQIMETFKIAAIRNANRVETASAYAVSVTYTVNAVCDTEWLDEMNLSGLGGLDDAEFIIDEISDGYESWAGIRLYGSAVRGTTLNNSSSNPVNHINEAINEYGIGNKEMMIAFSGYRPQSVQNTGGYAYYGEPTAILFLQTYDEMWKCGRHETGHMFDIWYPDNYFDEDGDGINEIDGDCMEECVMNNFMYDDGYYNNMCSDCLDTLNDNKNMHK